MPTTPPCSGTYASAGGPQDIAVAQDGTLWYSNLNTHAIGHLVPGGTIDEFSLSTMGLGLSDGKPETIKIAADGSIWVAVNGGYSNSAANAVVKVVPASDAKTATATVYKFGATLQPFEVAPDAKGNVWVTGTAPTAVGGPIARLNGVVGGAITTPPVGDGTTTAITTTPATTSPPAVTVAPSTTIKATVVDPTVHNDSISANQICVGPPQDKCSLVYLIQTHEYVTGFPHTGSAAAAKLTTIGKATFTLSGGQKKKVTVKLNSKGKKLLKKIKHFKATLTVTETHTGSKKPKQILKKNVTFKKK